ncbi:RNA-directed DNA polymerase [Dyadobacter chenhuakuii]|uniref:RNA-directed DNA polymerase n=1 Tax=Dyadobacter chenhuakuii TaxID=2909339 RepID=A0ABY4XP38_9BACT|nr:RNA-directed DNA polymerase [Dyadobacter chenhuakuii]MCF2494455.1 RNA-directed DNA polymerase [Dyadobacter chenhuakuii]USJ32219.1 RNA-directed DNA polymerase [Dyadobacter chenhuakuii]
MKIEDLLAKGYFPKELPPPFNTVDFASKYGQLKPSLAGCITKEPTRCIDFSVAKVGLVRKTIKIPNPVHQTRLCEIIVENWEQIESIYKLSKFSFSRPKLKGDRASNIGKFKNFMRRVFLESYPYSYELKTDISKYYPSIYTHSIPWAIHGKNLSKTTKGKSDLLGDKLDTSVRNTMYGQTVGIPMGPDTSHIISEIIGCKIDEEIANKFPSLRGCRYVDDMYFFFHSEAEAEDALLKLQQTLKVYELQINADKTIIRQIPRGIEADWVIQLRSFEFRDTEFKQNNDIISFFSLAFDLAIKLPKDFVLTYAVERVKRLVLLSDANFALLETMLLKTIIAEPSTIKEVFRIFYSHKSKVRVSKLETVLSSFIEYHCQRRNEYELSWALWIARSFEIVIPAEIVAVLSKIDDPINGLLILHLLNLKLINHADLDLTRFLEKLNVEYLTDENWIFTYEISLKKWIGNEFSYIDKNPYFKQLRKAKVSFYNEDSQIEVIDFLKKQIVEPDQGVEYGS